MRKKRKQGRKTDRDTERAKSRRVNVKIKRIENEKVKWNPKYGSGSIDWRIKP